MKALSWPRGIVLLLIVLASSACAGETPYSNPPDTLQESDLAGTWNCQYTKRDDTIILRADGTFMQVYHDNIEKDYVFETPWNEWWLERSPVGWVRLHLQGARYYPSGIRWAELEGRYPPCPTEEPGCGGGEERPARAYFDPLTGDPLDMLGELVLSVQATRTGDIVLLHMLDNADAGAISLFEGRAQGFRRVEPLQ